MAKGIKTGGRQKGTPNKRTRTVEDLQAMAEAAGVEPFAVFLEYCKDKYVNKPELRITAAREAAKYIYNQRRAVELTGADKGPIEVESSAVKEILQDLKSIIDTKVNERKG